MNLPLQLTALFLIECVFRASFMFLYPSGTFEYDPLSQFVVFEIPTFLLFSAVIVAIYAWVTIVSFDISKDSFHRNIGLVLSLIFVWSLWIIVTVVYAEVILANNSGYSPCVGRVPLSYSTQESDTQTLTIIYQSIIIAITFLLVCVFFIYTLKLFQTAKRTSSSKQFVMVVGGVINIAFLVRCILFLILLSASIVSSVYLFITLMVTEVLPMSFLLVQFNYRRIAELSSSATTVTRTSRVTSSPSKTSNSTEE